MDIQKELEAFRDKFPTYGCVYNRFLNSWSGSTELSLQHVIEVNASWKGWLKAKQHAIPDGYILVPREPSLKHLDRLFAEHDLDDERATYIYRDIIDSSEFK